MTDVYLKKLKLKGFRSYKSEREITFPAGPGLTVIVGPNGLGKSTLFDAVEWGLTGELRRLEATEGKMTEKKKALGQKPEVQLWFSDEAHIHRSLTKEMISSVDVGSIKDWLTAEKWRGVNSIADCLQLTHFLGQSSGQMFVHLDGKKRWGLLEGPAGLQSLWKVESTLGRKHTDLGFDRVQEDFLRDEAKLREELTRIEGLLEQLRTRRDLERADDILATDEILLRCQRISDELEIDLQTISIPQQRLDPQVPDVDRILQSQRKMLDAAEQQLKNQRAQLAQWPNLALNYSELIAKQESLRQERELAVQESDAAEESALAAVIQTTLTRTDHQSLVDKKLAQQTARDAVIAEIERYRQILAANEKLQTAKRLFADLTTKYTEQTHLISKNKAILETLDLQRNKHAELVERGSSLKALFAQAEGLLREDSLRQAARLELISLPASEAALKASIDEQRQALVGLEAEVNALKLQKEAALAVSNAISAGVAQIASALGEEDCTCPVCQTTFNLTGRLKEIATQQANVSDWRLVDIAEQILKKDERILTTQQEMFELNTRVARLQERHEDLTKLVFSADQLENSLRGTPLLSGLDIGAFLPTLTTAVDQIEKEIKDLVATISSGSDVIAVRAEIRRLGNLQQETTSERGRTAVVLASLERELEQLHNWPTSGETVEQLHSAMLEHESDLQKISRSLLESQSKLEAAQVNETQLNVKMAEKKKLVGELDGKLATLHQTEKDLAERWTRQGYAGAPLSATVQKINELHDNASLRLHRISQEHSVLLDGRRRYLAHVDLQQLEANLKAECDKHEVQNIENVMVKINTQLAALKNQQNLLSRVKEKRTNLLSQLKQKATDIRNSVSEPLNANTERFCSALMSDRAHQVNLSAIASAATAQALLSFQPDGKGEPKNPLLYMSEGQLAATSLCLLFGASVTYPWSRWKALLMDDPLHHNDSIHAAAFIDVVRNLIRYQGYQIIVSTHDMEQAGYFLRKCRNAGITARYHHLYARSDDGTVLLQSE